MSSLAQTRPDASRRYPVEFRIRLGLLISLEDRLFGLGIEELHLAPVYHHAPLLTFLRVALGRHPRDHQVARLIGRTSPVLIPAGLIIGHLPEAIQAGGLVSGHLEVQVLLRSHALYDLRLDVHCIRPFRPSDGLGRRGLGVFEMLGPDAEDHVLAREGLGVVTPLLGPTKLFLGQRQSCVAEDYHVATVVLLEAGHDEVHRRAPDKACHKYVIRLVVHDLGGRYLLHLAVLEDHDAVGHGHGLGLVVGHVDGRGADPVVQLGDLRPHLHPELGVEVGEGLVHKERLRLTDYGPTQGHPLPLATGERLRLPVEETLDGEYPGCLVHPARDLRLVHLAEFEGEAHVLAHVHVRVEGVVLEDHGYVALARRKVVDDLIPYKDFAVSYVLEAGDHTQGRGLPATGGSDEDYELPVRDIQIHLVDGDHVLAEDFGYLLQRYFSHPACLLPFPRTGPSSRIPSLSFGLFYPCTWHHST